MKINLNREFCKGEQKAVAHIANLPSWRALPACRSDWAVVAVVVVAGFGAVFRVSFFFSYPVVFYTTYFGLFPHCFENVIFRFLAKYVTVLTV